MLRTAVPALLLAAASAHAQCTADLAFPDFAATAGLNLVGSAAQAGADLRLTPNAPGQAGAAWFAARASLAGGFTTEFTFRLSGSADGIAFVIQNESATAIGDGGSGLGYGWEGSHGITSSLAVEIDTFSFQGEFDSDHLSIQTNGAGENDDQDEWSRAHAVLPFDVNDGQPHTLRIVYTAQSLTVFIDNFDNPVITHAIDLEDIGGSSILDDSGCAWIGFTAGTGAATADQDILSWSFTNSSPDCTSVNVDFDSSSFQFRGEWGGRMEQDVAITGSSPRTYQWFINSVPLEDDWRIQGAQTPHLIIEPLAPTDAGQLVLQVDNDCSGLGVEWTFALCGTADYNGDGDVGTDQDIESFFACLGGNCCPLCQGADFNFDGDVGTDQDIESFFRVLGGGPC